MTPKSMPSQSKSNTPPPKQTQPRMNPVSLLVTQLLPLMVFIVVDAMVTDVRISIFCAVVFAVGQLILTFVKTRRFDWLVLVDVALISILGGISIVSQNELFFKVKPAVIEGLAVAFFLGMIFAPDSFLQRYLGRFTPGMEMKPQAVRMMKSLLLLICISTALHIGAVLYTAFYASKEMWVAVSGPGFYVTMVPAFLYMVLKIKRNKRRLKK